MNWGSIVVANRLQVLLIDDDEDSLVITRELLSQRMDQAFDLAWAGSYEAGLEALRQGRHDVCLLDYRLGARDGLELLRQAVAEGCRVPIIFLTGQGDREVDLQAMKTGAVDYLIKDGLNSSLLERALRYAIERRRAEEERLRNQVQLHVLTEQLGAALWSTDRELRFTSSMGNGILGPNLQPNDLVGRTVVQHFQAVNSTHPVLAAHGHALTGQSVSFERQWRERTYQVWLEPLWQKNQRVIGTVGVALDITDARRRNHGFMVARQIQQSLLPRTDPRLADFDISGICHPADATGGDFFDYLTMRDGTLGIVVADVSSHGFAPALVMSSTRRLLRTLAQETSDVAVILSAANRAIAEDASWEYFVTLFFAKLDPRTGILLYAGAGHEGFLLDSSGTQRRLVSTAPPLGADERSEITCGAPFCLDAGQILVMLTDGFAEAQAPDGNLFGTQRVLDLIRSDSRKPAADILNQVFQQVTEFCRPARHADDITAVVVKVNRQD